MHGEKYGNDFKIIPLSKDTVSYWISTKWCNIKIV